MTPAPNLLVLRVADLVKSRRFYEALGLEFVSEQHGKGPEHLAADLGGFVFELYPVGSGASTAATRIGFALGSLEARVARASESGGQIVKPVSDSRWGRRAVVLDPDGHSVELSEVE